MEPHFWNWIIRFWIYVQFWFFFLNFHTQVFNDLKIRMIAFQLRNYTIYIYLLYISRRNLDATTEGRLLKNFNIDMKYQQKYRGSKALLWTDVAGKFSEMGVEKRRPSRNSIKRFSPPFSLPSSVSYPLPCAFLFRRCLFTVYPLT